MQEVQLYEMLKGEVYFIDKGSNWMRKKRVGIFEKTDKFYGDMYASFSSTSEDLFISDSSLFKETENSDLYYPAFSSLNYKFYKRQALKIEERSIQRQAVAQTIDNGTCSNIGSDVSSNISSW